MQSISIISLFLTLILCSGASITDFRRGKIYNRMLFPITAAGLACNILNLLCNRTGDALNYALNILILTGLAMILFYNHTWAGGDAKFLISVGIVYPVSEYFEVNGYEATLWMLLIATFLIGFLYILADTVIQLGKEKQAFHKKDIVIMIKSMICSYFRTLIFIMAFSLLYHYFIENYTSVPDGIYLLICILLSFAINRYRIFRERFLIITVMLFDLAMVIMTSFVPVSLDIGYYLLILSFMCMCAIASRFNYQIIDTDSVRKGMVLSRVDTIVMVKSRVKGLPGISDETLASRLTMDEAESVRRWKNSRNGKDKVTIVRKIPFAVFITAGVLCYLIVERLV